MTFKNKFASEYTSQFKEHSAIELVKQFKSGKTSISEYLTKLFNHIEKMNPELNALTSIQKEHAFERAKQLEAQKVNNEQCLYGVPIILKENIQKINFPVECASKILKGYTGQFNATVVNSFEKAGAIFIATANMDEFAMGSSNEHSCHGVVKNPHDVSRVSGGSSGGSAVACAAGFGPIALGSDTGGSVRQPAGFCGIYGLKPTYGRVSRYGLVAFGSSLDQISPFARTMGDLDLMMRVMAHEDPRDATSLTGSYASSKETYELKGKKIGVLRSVLKEGVDDNVMQEFLQLEENLKKHGVTFVDIEIPSLEHTLSVYYLIACAEASTNLSRFDGIRYGHRAQNTNDLFDLYCKTRAEGFGHEVKRRIMLGTFSLSAGFYDAFYGKAQTVRDLMAHQFDSVFKEVDFIYLPTSPASAFHFGINAFDPIKEYLYDIFTIPANLIGVPAISVPANVATGTLPVGLQFMAKKGSDANLIAFAAALENKNLVGTTRLL
ncbi:Asp-tRNA(Asn)/Glu-tRNA(Gln) amidotransferase subunit GatA [Spirobacillus cienkowskii]|jgi:aspartyl-tRNA(Asn)/glutamyl-tRNA(Gln) amidotransferase subunit A|uniref:Glutamyl-tRNA(Gln) amidotransferase subunit A n=1 Tax=Spirobacillus cienkowskii TaxID=495820 RepID=A0A369KSH4_9BACT|nr:MAG: Asp-tRNA(Asn)/Glu-tRNA(Gln) amidotransferase subunit GatA [Spirobacillus cienkowskii]